MPPVDVFSEAQGLQRRRALLQALQQRSAAPQIQGTPGQGIAQLLAALGTSYFAGQGLDRLDQQEADNQGRYQEGLAGELERFMQTSQGAPNEMLPPDVMGPPQLGQEADPKAAVLAAMTSRFPEMQGVGKAMLPGLMQKPKAPEFDEWKVAPDGRTYRTNKATGALELGEQNFPKPAQGPLVVNEFGKSATRLREKDIESLLPKGDEFAAAQAARTNLQVTGEAVAALNAGAKTGIFADAMQAARKVAKALGADVETASNDQLQALLAQRVLAISSERPLAGPLSNADLEFLRQSAGATSTDPEALRRILALSAAQSFNLNRQYSTAVEETASSDSELGFMRRHLRPTNFYVPPEDTAFMGMFERALRGQPTVEGKPVPAVAPTRAPNSGITYTPRGGR